MPRVAVPMVPRYNELAEVCSLHRLFGFFSKAQRAIGRLGGNKKARAGTGNEREIELRKSSGVYYYVGDWGRSRADDIL